MKLCLKYSRLFFFGHGRVYTQRPGKVHRILQKTFYEILNDYQNSFTGILSEKFGIHQLINRDHTVMECDSLTDNSVVSAGSSSAFLESHSSTTYNTHTVKLLNC